MAAELGPVIIGALGEAVSQGAEDHCDQHGGHVLQGKETHNGIGHGVSIAQHGAPAFAEIQGKAQDELKVQGDHGEQPTLIVGTAKTASRRHAREGLDNGEQHKNEDDPSKGAVEVLDSGQHVTKIRGYLALMRLDLKGKHALVCGASQGIGWAAAKELADLGARCTLMARNPERLEAAAKELPGTGHGIAVADFTQPDAVSEAAKKVVEQGPVDILINNTGGPPGGPAHAADTQAYLAAFTQHLMCNQRLVQAVLPGMRAAGGGRIVNVISTSVKQPLDGLGVSNTVRGAVANWAKTLANELGPDGITVNNVLPGATRTARLDQIAEAKAAKTGQSPAEVLEGMAQAVPLRRLGEAEEIGAAIAFLCSPAAAYISGINLPVDGGRTRSL